MSGHVGHESAPRCPKCKATQRRTKFHQMRSRTLPTVIAKDAAAKEANVCSRKMGTTLTKAKNLCYRCHHFLLHREDHITMHGHYVTRVRDCHEKERKHEENMEEKKHQKDCTLLPVSPQWVGKAPRASSSCREAKKWQNKPTVGAGTAARSSLTHSSGIDNNNFNCCCVWHVPKFLTLIGSLKVCSIRSGQGVL